MRSSLLGGTALLALAAGLFLGTSPASANVVFVGPATSNTGNLSSTTLQIPLFQESLGTLNSVLVTTTYSADYSTHNGTFSFSGVTSSAETGTAQTTIHVTGGPSDLNGSAIVKVSQLFGSLTAGSSGTAILDFNGTNTVNTGPFTDVAAWETNLPGGYSTVTLSSALTADSLTGASGLTFAAGLGPDVNVLYSIAYNYTPSAQTPAPEPASILTLGSGLLGLGGLRWRRKRTRPRSPPEA